MAEPTRLRDLLAELPAGLRARVEAAKRACPDTSAQQPQPEQPHTAAHRVHWFTPPERPVDGGTIYLRSPASTLEGDPHP